MNTETAYTYDMLARRWVCSVQVLYDLVRSGKLKEEKNGHQG